MSHYKIKFHPNADKDIEESFDWYLAKSNLAALNFLEMVDKRIEEVRQHPKRYAVKWIGLEKQKLQFTLIALFMKFLKIEKIIYVHSVFH